MTRVYGCRQARDLGAAEPFPVEEFLAGTGTCSIVASAERQLFFAPLVVGLLEQTRRPADQRRATDQRGAGLFALGELANIGPLPDRATCRPELVGVPWWTR